MSKFTEIHFGSSKDDRFERKHKIVSRYKESVSKEFDSLFKTETSIVSLIGIYASYLIPIFGSNKLTTKEILISVIFISTIFMTIFISSVIIKLNEFKCELKCIQAEKNHLICKYRY